MFFINGNSFNDFIEFQKAMLNYQLFLRQHSYTPTLRILQILTNWYKRAICNISLQYQLNHFRSNINLNRAWNRNITDFNPLTWSIAFASAILAFYYAYKKRDYIALTIPVLLLTFIAIFSTAQVFEWYLLPILFSGFISTAYLFKNFYENMKMKTLLTSL